MVSTRSRTKQETNSEVNDSPPELTPNDEEDDSNYDPASDEDFHDDDNDHDDEELEAEVSVEKEAQEAERVREFDNTSNVEDIKEEEEEEEEEDTEQGQEGKEKRAKEEPKVATAKKKQKISHSNDSSDSNDKNNSKSSSTKGTTSSSSKQDNVRDLIGGIILEYAKSGRASCRKCSATIEKNTPRVGMEAWITGRQAMTWQHVLCFVQNLSVMYESTGRSKCSITGENIPKGTIKMVAHSHTAHRYYTMDVIEDVLSTVLSWVPFESIHAARSELSVKHIQGANELNKEDQEQLDFILARIAKVDDRLDKRGSMANQEDQAKPDDMKTQSSSCPRNKELDEDGKPKKGVIAKQQGTVEWNFAGSNFQGTLLPNKETKSQCFAKTHKGNIKTLNKDKDYWSIVAN